MDATVITALIENVGVPAAAIFAAIGYWYKNRREHMKSTRKVLYLMLELRHAMLAGIFDPKNATEAYFAHSLTSSKKLGLDLSASQISEGFRMMVMEHFENIVSSQKIDIEKLLPSLEQALSDMACENPVLAFQLRGREKLEKIMSHTRDYQAKVAANLAKEIEHELIRSVLLETSSELADDALQELCRTIDDDVLDLAKAIGRGDYRKCKKAIKNGLNYENRYDFKELDNRMEKLIQKLMVTLTSEQKAA